MGMCYYQERDAHIVDYGIYELPGVKPHPGAGRFRGPRVIGPTYIACIGAAQTFGCLCTLPFPFLLGTQLAIETLNLGYGGAGPTFHNSNARLLQYINQARMVVVQVLSGRSQSNSHFQTTSHARVGVRIVDGERMTAEQFYFDVAAHEPEKLKDIVEETRENYINCMVKLLEDIKIPKILFWFSQRSPDYKEVYGLSIWDLFGGFPQLVNRRMVDAIRRRSDAFVECVSSRGLPQQLHDKSGKPAYITVLDDLSGQQIRWTQNDYYPSPEMHDDAAKVLAPVCRRFL